MKLRNFNDKMENEDDDDFEIETKIVPNKTVL
jgi:hypothetical protein